VEVGGAAVTAVAVEGCCDPSIFRISSRVSLALASPIERSL